MTNSANHFLSSRRSPSQELIERSPGLWGRGCTANGAIEGDCSDQRALQRLSRHCYDVSAAPE